jgi:hypothetical protein
MAYNVTVKPRWYEYHGHEGRENAAYEVSKDMEAAARLGIPTKVQEHSFDAFRGGGNVVRAQVRGLKITFGEAGVTTEDPEGRAS